MAIAAAAGCSAAKPMPGIDGVDWTVSKQLPHRLKVDIQLKCTSDESGGDEFIAFPLKRRNYDDAHS